MKSEVRKGIELAKVELAKLSNSHNDIYRCGCEYPNGCTFDHEFDFVCDHCYEAQQRRLDIEL